MCGDLDEGDRFEGDLFQRFLVHAQVLLERKAAAGDGLNAQLDRLFADLLKRCEIDSQAATDPYRLLAMQSLVMARLAGFLAGHVALQEDPLRKLMEAVMLGYGEAETTRREHHHHGDDHDHDHAHEHGHGQGQSENHAHRHRDSHGH